MQGFPNCESRPFLGSQSIQNGVVGHPKYEKKNISILNIIEKINEIWQSDDDNLILIHNGAYEDLSLYLGQKNCNAPNNTILLSYCARPLSGLNALFN